MKNKTGFGLAILILFSVVLSLGFVKNSGAADNAPSSNSWDITTVETKGNVGQYSSLAIDGNGKAHIASFKQSKNEKIGGGAVPYGNLIYSTNVKGDWKTTALDTATGLTPRIFADKNNNIHIVHTQLGVSNVSTLMNLKYTANKSGDWKTSPIKSAVAKGTDASIVVDADGAVHISTRNEEGIGTSPKGGQGGLRYITNASGKWSWRDVDKGKTAGNDTDIAVDKDGAVHIAYLDKTAGLKYATNAGGSWKFKVIDGAKNVGWNASIAVDSNRKAHISYSDPSRAINPRGKELLKYATNASGEWKIQIIDDKDSGFYTSLAVDGDDNIHIAYYTWDGRKGKLRYTTDTSGSWAKEVVDDASPVGLFCAIDVDVENNPHISYYDYAKQDLKYARKK